MRYLRWDEEETPGLPFGLVELWTEIDDKGTVRRELGFDAGGHICHRCPSKFYRYGAYGLFDLAPVEIAGTADEVEPTEFERRWRENELAD